MPPRAATNTADGASQTYPVLRGDRLAFNDFTDDPFDRVGCHGIGNIAVASLSRGTVQNVLVDSVPKRPIWLGTDRLYIGHWLGGFAHVRLPP